MTKDIDETRKHLEEKKIMDDIMEKAEDLFQRIFDYLENECMDETVTVATTALMLAAARVAATHDLSEDVFLKQIKEFHRSAVQTLRRSKE